MKKLLLINPVSRRSGYMLSRFSRIPPLSLAYVAAVTPGKWNVEILDEVFQPCNFEQADLVGITATTSTINRAYAIAKAYLQKKIPVVIGGIHASMLPEEAFRYSSAVVAGEVEGIWESVLADFEKGQLGGIYRGPRVEFSPVSKYGDILPRRDLLHPSYAWSPIQTSRGCPFDCTFCSVSRYLGRCYRQRSAGSVLRELGSIEGRKVVFLDDNLIGHTKENRERALAIFSGMVSGGMKKEWWMQASINVADDDEVLHMAAAAGCTHVFIGFETRNPKTLGHMKKKINAKTGTENYKRVVERIHAHGIGVFGAFIIGNDHENADYYRELSEFIIDAGIDVVQVSILTPLPGTALMEQVMEKNRILFSDFPADWEKYRFSHVTFEPEGVREELIYTANNYIKKRLYAFPRYQLRVLHSCRKAGTIRGALAAVKLNAALKRAWKKAHYHDSYPHEFKTG